MALLKQICTFIVSIKHSNRIVSGSLLAYVYDFTYIRHLMTAVSDK